MAMESPKMILTDRDIDQKVEDRVRELREMNSSLSLDYLVISGEHGRWGVIIYADYSFETMGLEFIESNDSWRRPEAVEQYNGLMDEGYCVAIYAPSRNMAELASLLKQEGGKPNLRLAPIEDTSKRPRALKEL